MKIDLNLLPILDAIFAERNISRAAKRVHLSQSAVSHALARLRELFGDPLFVRTPTGMLPTARGAALEVPIRQALTGIKQAITPRKLFDPREAAQTFTLAATDYVEFVALPKIIAALSREAPKVNLVIKPIDFEARSDELKDGKIDVALGLYRDMQAPFFTLELFRERFVCLVRRDHPRVKAKLSLKTFVSLSHVLISPLGVRRLGLVDQALEARGMKRRIALSIPHYLIAPMVIANSDLIITLPERVACSFAQTHPLKLMSPPCDLPGFTVSAIRHERTKHEPAHNWFSILLENVCKNV